MADGQTFTETRPAAQQALGPVLYAERGALQAPGYSHYATKLYADPQRRRWVMVAAAALVEGELIEDGHRVVHPITWGA